MALKQSREEACQCHAAIEELRKEMQAMRKDQQSMRTEQQEMNEQLLSGLQRLLDRDSGPSRSKESVKALRPPRAPRGHTDRSGMSECMSIPEVVELERALMMSESKKHPSKRSAVHPLDPVAPDPEPPESDPPKFTETTTSGRRGSTLGILDRNSQSQILAPDTVGEESAWAIFEQNIGVRMWLRWRKWMIYSIVLSVAAYSGASVALQLQGLQESGEHFASFALLFFSIVAILFLILVKRSLRSEELNLAMQKVDEFVQDCGRGLDWASVAKKSWRRFLALWLLVLLSFATQQSLEVRMAEARGYQSAAAFRLAKGATGTVLFALSSAVAVIGAYFQLTLVQGLQKSVDCWCGDLMEDPDFVAGINSWNTLQALVKCVGREITPCFLALSLFGHAGFFASVAASFSLLLGDNLVGQRVALYEFALLPLIYLFCLSTQLFAGGAGLSATCRQVPAFVNQLRRQNEPDADRQYLVGYISRSETGFVVAGVTLTPSALLKQMHLLTAVCSGFGGILIRRFLADGA
eukprot:Skav209286  [mRNA]  locus=scaffold251:27670:29241:+ [translate_table: standard]